jgi:preprotein translocase subunit SecA
MAISDYSNFICVWRFFSDREIEYKTGRLDNKYRYDQEEKQFCEDYSFLPMKQDGDNRFRQKYADINVQKGQRANLKHTNRENVKRMHAVNHERIYQQTRQIFQKFCDIQHRQSFQHWQAKELSEFLNKMAMLEGYPNHKVNLFPEISETTNEISMMKENMMNIFNAISDKLFSQAINFEQYEIGNLVLSHDVTEQAELMRQQQADINQILQAQMQSIDFSQLSNGLQVVSGDVETITGRLNRMVNEKRFSKELSESRRRIQYLYEMPNEKLSEKLLRKQNIKLLPKPKSNVKFKTFVTFRFVTDQYSDNFIKSIEEFNSTKIEENLLKCGLEFLKYLIGDQWDFENSKTFISTYEANLKKANFSADQLKELNNFSEKIREKLIKLSSTFNKDREIDLLIGFEKRLNIEYSRHYTINRAEKTLLCLRRLDTKKARDGENDIIEGLIALRKTDSVITHPFKESTSLLLEFQSLAKLFTNTNEQFDNYCSSFINTPDTNNYLAVLDAFSQKFYVLDSTLLDDYFKTIDSEEKLQAIDDFFYAFKHNFQFFNMTPHDYDRFYECIERIESFLQSVPPSCFHEKFFALTIEIELMKLMKNDEPDEKLLEKLALISHGKDINAIRNQFRLPYKKNKTPYKPLIRSNVNNKFTLEQLLISFKSQSTFDLIHVIIEKISTVNKDKVLELSERLEKFFGCVLENVHKLKKDEMPSYRASIMTVLGKNTILDKSLNVTIKFLDLIFIYQFIKERYDEEVKRDAENKVEDVSEELVAKVKLSIRLIQEFKKGEHKAEIAKCFHEEWNQMQPFGENYLKAIPKQKLEILKNNFTDLLKHFNDETNKKVFQEMEVKDSELEKFKETSLHFLASFDTQLKVIMKKEDRKILIETLEALFKYPADIDLFLRNELVNRLANFESEYKSLIEEAKFCDTLDFFAQTLGKRVKDYLKKNNQLVTELKKIKPDELDDFLFEDSKSSFVRVLKLLEYSKTDELLNEQMRNVVEQLKNNGTQRNFNQLIFNLINEYLDANPAYNNLKTFINSEKFKRELNKDNLKNIESLIENFSQEEKRKINRRERHHITKELIKHFETLLKKKTIDQNKFEFVICLKMFIDELNNDLERLNESNAASCELRSLILENILLNSEWVTLHTKDYGLFFEKFFKMIQVYETRNIIEWDFSLMPKLFQFVENYSINNSTKMSDYNETLKSICDSVKLSYVTEKCKELSLKSVDAKIIEIIALFPEYFDDTINKFFSQFFQNDNVDERKKIECLKKLIQAKMLHYQQANFNEIEKFLDNIRTYKPVEKEKQIAEISKSIKELDGSLLKFNDEKDSMEYLEKNSYYVINFNRMIDNLKSALNHTNNIYISYATLLKCFQCFRCFEDISIAASVFTEVEQNDWLHNLIVESVIEKYCLVFLNKYPVQCLNNENVSTLRLKMKVINDRVLFVFHNLFTNEYIEMRYNKIVKDTQTTTHNRAKLTEDKFHILINLMQGLLYSNEILDQLSDATLIVWEALLNELLFNQYFNRKMNELEITSNDESVEKMLLYLNRIRLQVGNENREKFMSFFSDICRKLKQNYIRIVIELIEAVHYQFISFDQACSLALNKDIREWQSEIENLKSKSINSRRSQKDRTAYEIIELMLKSHSGQNESLSKRTLEKIADEATEFKKIAEKMKSSDGDEKSRVQTELMNIYNSKDYQNDPEKYVRTKLNKAIPLLLYAWYVANKPQFPKETQIVALLIFVHSRESGMLEQVKTGEGKTLTVGLIAAFMAFCGKAVDIVSSNRDLGIEGEEKCHSFYELLKIDSGHILSENEEERKQAYKLNKDTHQGNIVYGDVGSFQRDILEEEFNNKEIHGERYKDRGKCLIVDEVDNMCLDKARHVLYLSHEIECLKSLESLFIIIWAAVLRAEIKNVDDVNENVTDIAKFIQNVIASKRIEIPGYLYDYINYKLDRWIESAFQARMMRENDHFIIDTSKSENSKERKIIVVDKDTGVEQYSTRWSNGLAQFLELKYRRKISVESLKAIFISNKTYFQRYGKCLYGLTGTLGSENSKAFLSDMYGVKFADIPTSRNKCFHLMPSVIEFEFSEWLESIARETKERLETRPVLIICENLELSNHIYKELINNSVSPSSIVKYARDGDNVEERFRKKPASAGDVIIATNKGGRGTDIHVDPKINEADGMHVILTFLPDNVRIEEQAFGRTSRNGAPGTGQFVLQVEKTLYEEMYDLDQLTGNARRVKLKTLSDVIVEREKVNRDNKETARLSELKQKNILHLEIEEDLFTIFTQFKAEKATPKIKKLLENDEKINKHKEAKALQKDLCDAFEKSLKDKWAFWLDEIKKEIDKINASSEKMKLINNFKETFIKKMQNTIESSNSFSSLLLKLVDKPEEALAIGKVCVKYEIWAYAEQSFLKSMEKGDISGSARIGLAASITKNAQDSSQVTLKKKLRKYLKEAMNQFDKLKQTYMSNFKMADHLAEYASDELKQFLSSKDNPYQEQVQGKIEVIGIHLHYLKKCVGDTLEPTDFIREQGENLDDNDVKKSKDLYNLLAKEQIIQPLCFKKSSKDTFKKEINESVDPSMADDLISLIQTKYKSNLTYEIKDFEDLVCCNEELWEMLKLKNCTEVNLLQQDRLEKELPVEETEMWAQVAEHIDPMDLKLDKLEEKLKKFIIDKELFIKTYRAKVEDFEPSNVKFEGKFSKYAKIKFINEGKTQSIVEFLQALKAHLVENKIEYLYQTNLPYGTREEEAAKLVALLKEKNILKSGGLNLKKFKYGEIKEALEKSVSELIKDTIYKNDKDFIIGKLCTLQGEIRAAEEKLSVRFKDFMELEDVEKYPAELDFFSAIALDKFIEFKEEKSWWDWRAFAVAMIGLAQVIGGTLLCCFGFPNIGMALIIEGVNDMVYATMAGLSGNFSWRDWAIQKAISMCLSLLTCGIGALAGVGTAANTVGSISKTAIFMKCIGKAAFKFATTCLTNFISDKIMEHVANNLIKKVVDYIETNLLGGLNEAIKQKVTAMYANSKNDKEFADAFAELKHNFEKALYRNAAIDKHVDQIRSQIVNTLTNNMSEISDGLSKSQSKYAKIVSDGIKVALIVNQLWRLISTSIQTANIIQAIAKTMDKSYKTNSNNSQKRALKPVEIQDRVKKLTEMIKTKIISKITQEVSMVVRQLVGILVKKLAQVAVSFTKNLVSKATKNPIEKPTDSTQKKADVLKDFEGDKQKKAENENAKTRENIQNELVNPRESLSLPNSAEENRPLDLADVKALADMKMRNIVIDNKDTGEKTVIRPSGWRAIPAFFKQDAKINFMTNAGDSVGHYYNGRGEELYKPVNGRNDCLLIAYHESLGRKVTEDFIKAERAKFDSYVTKHQVYYDKVRADLQARGINMMIGGKIDAQAKETVDTTPISKNNKTQKYELTENDEDLRHLRRKEEGFYKAFLKTTEKMEEVLKRELSEDDYKALQKNFNGNFDNYVYKRFINEEMHKNNLSENDLSPGSTRKIDRSFEMDIEIHPNKTMTFKFNLNLDVKPCDNGPCHTHLGYTVTIIDPSPIRGGTTTTPGHVFIADSCVPKKYRKKQ